MALRTINHPDVEIREIDRSQATPGVVGTNVMICGFASNGEPYLPIQVSSPTDWLTNFGEPTTEAERYFYYGSIEVLDRGGNLIAAKLPYNNLKDNNYAYVPLTFETVPTPVTDLVSGVSISGDISCSGAVDEFSGYCDTMLQAANDVSGYVLGELGDVSQVSLSAYDAVVAGNEVDPSIFDGVLDADTDFIIVDESRGVMQGPEETGGKFIVIADYLDGLVNQRLLGAPESEVNDILDGVELPLNAESFINYPDGIIPGDLANYTKVHAGRVTAATVSRDLAAKYPTIDFVNNGDNLNTELRNTIVVMVCQQVPDPNFEGRLTVSILEAFLGSIIKGTRNPVTGQTVYLPDIVNAQSSIIKMYPVQKDNILEEVRDLPGNAHIVRNGSAARIIDYAKADAEAIIDGAGIPNDLRVIFEKVSDINEIQLDVIADNGISTIASFTDDVEGGTKYEPITDFDPSEQGLTSSAQLATWRAVTDEYITFCQNVRKDCMTILDTPRNLEIEGDSKRIRKTAPQNTFSNTIAPELRFVTGLNSSYAALYSNWRRGLDSFSGLNFWQPPTISVAGIYVNNDRVANIWDAPAGLNRGVIQGINDLAFQPSNPDADQLYTKSINYAKRFPLAGFVLEGQKTTQVRPSAFDRVNVRRLFLRLERFTYQVARFFVYEPNNVPTRARLVATLDPLFASYKAQGGIIDYKIVCDETNNTPDVIDRNELKVAIFVKPVRTAEFILVDFIATRTDANFNELL
jgi:hypothetical protein